MKKKAIILGSSGHAQWVLEMVQAVGGYELVGWVEKDAKYQQGPCGLPILGCDDDLSIIAQDVPCAFLGLGYGRYRHRERREELFWILKNLFALPTIIHPTAFISPSARLGEGTIVGENAVVSMGARVGKNCIINYGALVGHENIIGDGCHIAPGAVLGGNVIIGKKTLIGINATILFGVSIGQSVLVPIGARISTNVLDDVVLKLGKDMG